MSIQILIIEDEIAIREMVTFALLQQGYHVHEARDTIEAEHKLQQQGYDLILLDWMLPGRSGIQFLQQIKRDEKLSSIPVIMITAKTDEKDCILGLNSGADDYINKPFSPKELIARLGAVLRRTKKTQQNPILDYDGLSIEPDNHRVLYKQTEITLSTTEFKLLYFFMRHPDKVYSREKLLDKVWGDEIYVEDRTVDVYIRRLRKNLEPHGFDDYIQTIRGAGYRFSKPRVNKNNDC